MTVNKQNKDIIYSLLLVIIMDVICNIIMISIYDVL